MIDKNMGTKYTESCGTECPLCGSQGPHERVAGADRREYRLCDVCGLIFVPPAFHLDAEQERARYELHRNSIADAGYCAFLRHLLDPMRAYLNAEMRGLDYGCGPGPTLSELARRSGLYCEDYDPIFRPRELQGAYDFIFATEVFEHFREPRLEIERLVGLLKPGGCLGILTSLWKSVDDFSGWHYSRDDTHVCFYSTRTIAVIEERYGLEILWSDGSRAFIFRNVQATASTRTISSPAGLAANARS
jgi:SAM-dependent methyltransferase